MMAGRPENSIIAVGTILFVLILGCGGTNETCTGELAVSGKTHRGSAENLAKAKKFTCDKYCIEGTREYQDLYEKWLLTPGGKKAPDRNNKWAALEDPKIMAWVDNCANECLKDVENGTKTMIVKCR
jgi:hypothetical protein